MPPNAITLKIDGQRVERFARTPDIEEATRVTDAIKARYSLGWVGVAALFGMQPNNGGAMNVKAWRVGKRPMPMSHYYTALYLLGEFRISVTHVPKSDNITPVS